MNKEAQVTLTFIDNFTRGLNAAAASARKDFANLAGSADEESKKTAKTASTMVDGIKGYLTDLTEHAKWASLFVGQAFMGAFQDIVNTASEFEKLNIATKYLTGSTKAAKEFYNQIDDIALKTPFTIAQIAELGKRLVGNTEDVNKSSNALRSMVDAVVATGGGYSELEGTVRAWIQTNSKAKASSEELNRQFANANIPVLRVLAEAIVNDADNPLRKYISTAGSATGASKTLAHAFEKANENLPILELSLQKAKHGLEAYEQGSKKTAEATDAHHLAVMRAQLALDRAKGSIEQYNTAQSKTAPIAKKAALSVEAVMAELQNLGGLDIPGSLMADQIVEALNKAYGGASQQMLNSFSGQLSMSEDNLTRLKVAIMGVNAEGTKQSGILGQLTAFLKDLNGAVDQNMPGLINFAQVIGESKVLLFAIAGIVGGMFYGFLTGIIAPVTTAALAFGGFAGAIGFLIDKFIDFGGKSDEAKGRATDLKGAIDDKLIPAYVRLDGKIIAVTKSIKGNQDIVQSIQVHQKDLGKSIDELHQKHVTPFETAVKYLKEALDSILKPLGAIWYAFTSLPPGIGNVKVGIDLLAKAVQIAAMVLSFFLSLLAGIALGIRFVVDMIGLLGSVLTGNTKAVQYYVAEMGTISNKLGGLQEDFYQTAVKAFSMNTDVTKSFSQMSQDSGFYASNLAKTTDGFFLTAEGSVVTHTNNMCTAVDTNFSKMRDGVSYASDSIFTTVEGDWTKTHAIANAKNEEIKQSTENNFSKIPAIADLYGANMMNDYKGAIDFRKGDVESSMSKVMSSVDSSMKGQATKAKEHGGNIIQQFIDGLISKAKTFGSMAGNLLKGVGFGDLQIKEHGGVVAGPLGAPIPIIAHGGERVVPRNGADVNDRGSRPVSVNINFNGGVVLDSEERVRSLADQVARMLGRQNELARYGVGI